MREDRFAAEGQNRGSAGITDAAKKVGEGMGELRRALSDRRQDVVEPVSQFIQERPLIALGVAFGIGYVLGGGTFTRTTGRLLGLGWKLGGIALAKSVIGNLGLGDQRSQY